MIELKSRPKLGLGDRLQPVLLIGSIVIGLAIGLAAPEFADSLSAVVSVGVFGLIYLVMLGVDVSQVTRVLTQRRFLALAITINFVVNPLLAWLLTRVFLSGQPELAVGLILFLVTPCIGWYLVFTELADGDVNLGVGLLGINLVLQMLLLPVYLSVFVGESASVEVGATISSIVVFLVAPAIAAATTRSLIKRSGVDITQLQGAVASAQLKAVALAIVIVAMFASNARVLIDNPGVLTSLVPPMVAFFGIAFVVALTVARLARLPGAQAALLVFTSTSRNSEASLAIAATAFASPLVALTVVIGPIIELPLLLLMVRVLRRYVQAADERPATHGAAGVAG